MLSGDGGDSARVRAHTRVHVGHIVTPLIPRREAVAVAAHGRNIYANATK